MLTDFDVEQGSSGAAAALTPGLLVPPVRLESSVSSSARARALTQSHCRGAGGPGKYCSNTPRETASGRKRGQDPTEENCNDDCFACVSDGHSV